MKAMGFHFGTCLYALRVYLIHAHVHMYIWLDAISSGIADTIHIKIYK